MRMVGFEPTRCYHRQILSLLRLPFRHIRTASIYYHNTDQKSNVNSALLRLAIPIRYIRGAPDRLQLQICRMTLWILSSRLRYYLPPCRFLSRCLYDRKLQQALRHRNLLPPHLRAHYTYSCFPNNSTYSSNLWRYRKAFRPLTVHIFLLPTGRTCPPSQDTSRYCSVH